MVIAEHPAFINPTIREALCELHFVLPEESAWDSAIYGRFFKHIQADFPELEPVTPVALQLQLTSGKLGVLPPQSRMRYKHASRELLLQLSEGLITVNILPRYAGWAQMQADIVQAWSWMQDVVKPIGIARIGLRYINFIPKAHQSEVPGDWLALNDYVAGAILASRPGFLSRAEVHNTERSRATVTITETVEDEQTVLVLDIDCIEEAEKGEFLELTSTLSGLHETAWQVFRGFISPRLQTLLDGDTP